MNPVISELWDKAATKNAILRNGDNSWESQVNFIETLVKLVATECANISDACFHDGSAGYLAIKNHFGIEDE